MSAFQEPKSMQSWPDKVSFEAFWWMNNTVLNSKEQFSDTYCKPKIMLNKANCAFFYCWVLSSVNPSWLINNVLLIYGCVQIIQHLVTYNNTHFWSHSFCRSGIWAWEGITREDPLLWHLISRSPVLSRPQLERIYFPSSNLCLLAGLSSSWGLAWFLAMWSSP